jgi:hypothetical protein
VGTEEMDKEVVGTGSAELEEVDTEEVDTRAVHTETKSITWYWT